MAEIESLQKKVATVRTELQRMRGDLEQALPRGMNVDTLVQVVLTSIVRNPKLLDCTPASFYAAIRQACQLGLMPDGALGEAAIVPFKNVAQFMPMYQGLLKLCYQSDHVEAIDAHLVFEGDEFRFSYGLEPVLEHTPKAANRTDPKKIMFAYAISWMKGGRPIFRVLDRAEIEHYRSRSRAKDDGPWITDWGAMALKTALLRITKLIPKQSENLQIAMAIAQQQEMGETGTDVILPPPDLSSDAPKRSALAGVTEGLKDRQSGQGEVKGQSEDTTPGQAPPIGAAAPQAGTRTDESPPPHGGGTQGQSVSDLMRRIMVQSKEAGVKLETIERWSSKAYGQNLVGCSVLNLQAILMRLQQGQSFDA